MLDRGEEKEGEKGGEGVEEEHVVGGGVEGQGWGGGADRSCIMKCWANLENSSWLKPEGLSFQNI